MSETKFKKGSQLFALARKKAHVLGIPMEKSTKMTDLVCRIQEKEGHSPCFQKLQDCSQHSCCWQASCKAVMSSE